MEFLDYIFNTEQNHNHCTEDPTDTQDLSSAELPTQAMTENPTDLSSAELLTPATPYHQDRFQQLILADFQMWQNLLL
jgi:hypothetical protein